MLYQFLPLVTGILGAMAHVLSGPDHLAAVTPFAIEEKKKSWKIGFFWGLGHITGMLLIGILFSIFKDYLPINEVSAYSEFSVGIILIGIGVWAIAKALKLGFKRRHFHIHVNDNSYIHSHEGAIEKHIDHPSENKSKKRILTNNGSAFYVGTIHGFAGIAHFILFLPILGFSSTVEIVSYIIGFAIGTLIAMIAYAMILGKISVFFHMSGNKKAFTYLRITSGVLAIVIGIYWMFSG